MGLKHNQLERIDVDTGGPNLHGVIVYQTANASTRVAGTFSPTYRNITADVGVIVEQLDTGVLYRITAIGTTPTTVEFVNIPSLTDAPTVFVNCIKSTPGTINPGQLVYIAASFDVANNVHKVELAKADNIATMGAIGFALDSITDSAVGKITRIGVRGGFTTTGASVNDTVYVSATVAGGIQFVKPTGAAIIQPVGIVSSIDGSNGRLEVFIRPNIRGGTFFSVQGGLSSIGGNTTKTASHGHNSADEPPVMTIDGQVIGLSCSLNSALTGGTLTVTILLNDVSQTGEVLLMVPSDQNEFIDFLMPISFNAGDTIGFQTDTVGVAPTGSDPTFYALCEET